MNYITTTTTTTDDAKFEALLDAACEGYEPLDISDEAIEALIAKYLD